MTTISNVKRNLLLPLFAVVFLITVVETSAQSIRHSVISAYAPFAPGFHGDLEYAVHDGVPLKLDLVLPKRGQAPRPVVIVLHGTAISKGRRGVRKHAEALSESGYVAVIVGFRHEAKDPFPAALKDVEASVDWVHANAKKYNLDKDRIGMLGFSGGGSLATLVSMQKPLRIRAVVSYFAPSDLAVLHRNAAGFAAWFVPNSLERWLGGTPKLVPQQYAKASPITYVHKDMAPHLLIHGTADWIVPLEQSRLLAQKMSDKQASVNLITFEKAPHNFDEESGYNAKAAFASTQLFFAEHLMPPNLALANPKGAR